MTRRLLERAVEPAVLDGIDAAPAPTRARPARSGRPVTSSSTFARPPALDADGGGVAGGAPIDRLPAYGDDLDVRA